MTLRQVSQANWLQYLFLKNKIEVAQKVPKYQKVTKISDYLVLVYGLCKERRLIELVNYLFSTLMEEV